MDCVHPIMARVPTVMEKHEQNSSQEKARKMGKNVLEIFLKKLWNFSIAYHESRTRNSNNSTIASWLWETFSLYSRFKSEC